MSSRKPRRGILWGIARWLGLGGVDDENGPIASKPPVVGSARQPTTTEEVDKASQSSVPIVVGKRLAWVSKGETAEHDDDAKTQDGDWTDTRGRMMRARVGAEAICRVERRYSRVRIGNIRMNREQFSVVIHPIRTSGLWNDDDPGPSAGSGTTTTSPSARITG